MGTALEPRFVGHLNACVWACVCVRVCVEMPKAEISMQVEQEENSLLHSSICMHFINKGYTKQQQYQQKLTTTNEKNKQTYCGSKSHSFYSVCTEGNCTAFVRFYCVVSTLCTSVCVSVCGSVYINLHSSRLDS